VDTTLNLCICIPSQDDGVCKLAECLDSNDNIVSLNLRDNAFQELGAFGLAKALREADSCLTYLNIGSNTVGPKGATELAEALADNTKLSELHMASNFIGDAGCKSIGTMLKVRNNASRPFSLHSACPPGASADINPLSGPTSVFPSPSVRSAAYLSISWRASFLRTTTIS
jgi:hypothetical protein